MSIVTSSPIVVGMSAGVPTIQSGPPVRLGLVSVFNSFDARFAAQSQTSLVPILVLNMNDSIPVGTQPGTVILRFAS